MNIAVFVLLFFAVDLSKGRKRKNDDTLTQVWNGLAYKYLERQGHNPTCKGCDRVREYLKRSDFTITDIQLEYAKHKILKQLGLEKPPAIKHNQKTTLPNPIREGDVFREKTRKSVPKKSTRTNEQVLVVASDIACFMESNRVNLKFSFNIPQRNGTQLTSAALWLFVEMKGDLYQMGTCHLTTKPCASSAKINSKEIHIKMSDVQDGWISKDVLWWLHGKENCQTFKLSCSDDMINMLNCSRYNDATNKPFLKMEETTEDLYNINREKRNVNCSPGVTDCCRERLYVSFSDIGWSDWIIQPKGYEAYYCKGSCANVAAITLGATPYHSVIKKVYNKLIPELIPCCAPTRLSPVQLIYMDENRTFIERTIQDLTVDSCGCM